jgi:hypothetical protein
MFCGGGTLAKENQSEKKEKLHELRGLYKTNKAMGHTSPPCI